MSPSMPVSRVFAAAFALLTISFGIRITTFGSTVAAGIAGGPSTPQAEQKPGKPWTMDDLLPAIADLGTGHDWNQGRELFKKAACGACHAFASEAEGAGLAPDLTAVASKFTRDIILQSILEPSATLNGQYFHTTFTLKNGDVVTGSVVDTANGKIVVAPVMLNPQVTVEIAAGDVKSEAPSPVSPMPAGLIDDFSREQVVALLAFLDAGGDRNAPVYRKK
jgi:putative heme-binding domain-containing protein